VWLRFTARSSLSPEYRRYVVLFRIIHVDDRYRVERMIDGFDLREPFHARPNRMMVVYFGILSCFAQKIGVCALHPVNKLVGTFPLIRKLVDVLRWIRFQVVELVRAVVPPDQFPSVLADHRSVDNSIFEKEIG